MARRPSPKPSPFDVALFIRNALNTSRQAGVEVPEERLRRLRAYTTALIAPVREHVNEGLLTHEELVTVLLSAALFAQVKFVMHRDELAFSPSQRIEIRPWGAEEEETAPWQEAARLDE